MFGIIIWNSKLLLLEMGLLIFKTLIKVTQLSTLKKLLRVLLPYRCVAGTALL